MRAKFYAVLVIFIIASMALSSCGPLEQIMAQVQQGQATAVPAVLTARAQTAEAEQTRLAASPTPTNTATKTSTPTKTRTPVPQPSLRPSITPFTSGSSTGGGVVLTAIPSLTPLPKPTNTPKPTLPPPCDGASFITDVTVDDGTVFVPGARFTKIWRLKNVGTCTWTNSYTLNYKSGDQMNGPISIPLPTTVGPGQTVDIPLNLIAPIYDGSYRGNWILKNGSGIEFGIGSGYKSSIYVDIKVSAATGGILFDFVSTACNATWQNAANGGLPCPGVDGDAQGFVLIQDSAHLEDGSIDSDPALITFPQQSTGGYIQGVYPSFTPKAGDRFKAVIGCNYGTSYCDVIFQLDYKIGNAPVQTLYQKNEVIDGQYTVVNIDLSSFAGTPLQLILTVHANGPATQDRAQWLFPHIYRGPGTPITPGPSPTPLPATATFTPSPTNTRVPRPTATP